MIKEITIESGETKSESLNFSTFSPNFGEQHLFGVVFPSAMTGTSISFEVSFDNGSNWYGIQDKDGTVYSVTITDDFYTYIDPYIFSAVPMIRVVSNAAEGANRTIGLILRSV